MKAKFTVATGEDLGLVFYVEDGQTAVLGRSRKTDVKLHDDQVSRQHCELRNTGSGLVLVDLGSSNGTYLNATRVDKADLADQDAIKIGSTTLVYSMDPDAEPPPEPVSDAGGLMGEFDEYLDDSEERANVDLVPSGSRPTQRAAAIAPDSDVVEVPSGLLASGEHPDAAGDDSYALADALPSPRRAEPAEESDDDIPLLPPGDTGGSHDDEAAILPDDGPVLVPPRGASESAQACDMIIGTTIAGCRIEERLKDIDSCLVFKGTQISIGRPLTLYLLRPHIAANAAERERFLNAARAAGRVYHPNIVHIYDAVETDESVCMLTEFVDGATAEEIIRRWARQGSIDLRRAVDIARQLATALAAAHEQGVIHRNVRPASILVTPTGLVKLTSLGLARGLDRPAAAAITPVGLTLGDAHYCAPEQVEGRPDIDHRADIYAWGATLFALLTGRAPFETMPGIDVGKQVTQHLPPSPSLYNPDLPPQLCAIAETAMAKDPSARFQSAAQMLEAIEAVERAM